MNAARRYSDAVNLPTEVMALLRDFKNLRITRLVGGRFELRAWERFPRKAPADTESSR